MACDIHRRCSESFVVGTIAMIRRRNADPFMHEIVYPTMEPRKLIKLLWTKAIEAYFDQIKTFARNACLVFFFLFCKKKWGNKQLHQKRQIVKRIILELLLSQ